MEFDHEDEEYEWVPVREGKERMPLPELTVAVERADEADRETAV